MLISIGCAVTNGPYPVVAFAGVSANSSRKPLQDGIDCFELQAILAGGQSTVA